MDVDNTTSEARAYESIDHASEQANSTSETLIVPLEPSSCVNLQGVGENISIVAPTPRRSDRIRNKQFVDVLLTEDSEIFLLENEEPTTYKQALVSPNSDKWLEAMKSEMESMSENKVWTLVDLPNGVKPIGCKWVYKIKTDKDGNAYIYKAKLVAKGYKQFHGIDYNETFSPVAMLKSIQILLAIAAFFDYQIWLVDVKTAFLNGFLMEEVYITQHEGFEDLENP